MRSQASVLHLDLDAFFASVEQRDKPSLRGKPVVVGGVGQRGVVATASYEARVFGVRSAMPAHEARRRCPHAAFLSGRFDAYREASAQVMRVLRELSPLVEPLSLDEAFVDLLTATRPVDFSTDGLTALVAELKEAVGEATGDLTASVGIGSSKFIAKVATELNKPDGVYVVQPGSEVELLRPMSVGVLPGVGPVTLDKLRRIGIDTVADLQRVTLSELVQIVGQAHGQGLMELAFARDDRPVEPEREAKSISVEDTFETDVADVGRLQGILDRDAQQVANRLRASRLFARTVTIKVRMHDFATHTRSRTLLSATDRPELITEIARTLLRSVDVSAGVRLLGVGGAGLTDVLQEDLFGDEPGTDDDAQMSEAGDQATAEVPAAPAAPEQVRAWFPGHDVVHEQHGPGWVWGSGLGRVTVRFETAETGPGPVRTFAADDPALHR
ncbi:MAG TPA: DNA polymerase IV [Propionibacteriaceae bacterium]